MINEQYVIQVLSDGSILADHDRTSSQKRYGKQDFIIFDSCQEAGEFMDGLPRSAEEYRILPLNVMKLENDIRRGCIYWDAEAPSQPYRFGSILSNVSEDGFILVEAWTGRIHDPWDSPKKISIEQLLQVPIGQYAQFLMTFESSHQKTNWHTRKTFKETYGRLDFPQEAPELKTAVAD